MILFFGSGTGSSPAGCAGSVRRGTARPVRATRSRRLARRARLREMHVAMAVVEPALVHPTWLVRALLEESPAVQRLVVASVPDSLRHSLQAGLLLDAQDIAPDHTVQPMFRDCVMGLWTERLLGGESSRPDDSPALLAVCGLSGAAGYRLCRVAGIAKIVLTIDKPAKAFRGSVQRSRAEWLHGRLSNCDKDFRAPGADRRAIGRLVEAAAAPSCRADRPLHAGPAARRRRAVPAALGPATLALPDCQAHALARRRARARARPPSLAAETEVLKTAWERLRLEGRLAAEWPHSRAESDDESRIT